VNNLLKNKNIIITGGLGLLGAQFSKEIAKQGGNPIVLDIRCPEDASQTIESKNLNCFYYQLDITNENKIEKALKKILQDFKKIDGLVNNAAINPKVEDGFQSRGFEDFSAELFNEQVSVGLTGAALMTKHVGKVMVEQETFSNIVNISSDLGVIAPDHRLYNKDHDQSVKKPLDYSIIKHGIIGLTKYTATHWPEKITCNTLCPGGVQNNQNQDFVEKINTRIPINRMAKVSEYNLLLCFLLSDGARYITGQTIVADGGRSVW
jgi:NAD(P)-dependent dehydrogenase (short-subunit alcohol dehydrogenase family)